jgi:hypothetical protein
MGLRSSAGVADTGGGGSMIGKSRLLVMLSVKERAKEIAEKLKASLEECRGIENMKIGLQAC